MISDVFRVTLDQLLDVETQIQSIELHFTYLQIKTRIRLQEWFHNTLIIDHCNKIKRKFRQLRNRRRQSADFTSNERKRFWFKNLCAKINETTLNEHTSIDREFKKWLQKKWKNVWSEYQTSEKRKVCVTLLSRIFKKRLKLHENLIKVESNLVTQMRIDRINLTKYLFHRRVFTVSFLTCTCEWFKQFIKHVVFFCFKHNHTRKNMFFVVKTHDFRQLLEMFKALSIITKWLMNTDLLTQFSLTRKCLEWFRLIE
jgi:hypothetical protein